MPRDFRIRVAVRNADTAETRSYIEISYSSTYELRLEKQENMRGAREYGMISVFQTLHFAASLLSRRPRDRREIDRGLFVYFLQDEVPVADARRGCHRFRSNELDIPHHGRFISRFVAPFRSIFHEFREIRETAPSPRVVLYSSLDSDVRWIYRDA